MTCEELGRAMKRAAVPGSSADGHTREAAAAMKNILLAVDDDIRRREQLGVDAGLRRPLAESLAAYADVNVMLTDRCGGASAPGRRRRSGTRSWSVSAR
ncbi:hypothetical protein PV749_18620 [Streptomyces sp. ID03-2B]|uniref:hypothetical protein n=1 Tax=Streptomyces sp. ID03-2B TaxID=3028660 RepID=UPI0029B38556|nr:hypothetical protein [Streptomyces sp. ID03-2B]MDX3593135.1 hypothetical protein [Streptomyces sp. ID03-2B]